MDRIDITIVRQQIENLKISHPELMEDEGGWLLSLESETDLDTLLSGIVDRMQEAASMADGIGGRIANLASRQERYEQRQKTMRTLAFKLMMAADVSKRELQEATLSIRNGQQKLIGDAAPETVPEQYRRVKTELDREAIKEAIKGGASVAGFELSNGEPSLSVRTK